jgi:GNAT superfamily N-acetyltransferase
MTRADLYSRSQATLLAAWEENARGASNAALLHLPHAAAAVFPDGPERDVYNNALLEQGLGAGERAEAVAGMEHAYAAAGVGRFAAWVHETDLAMRAELEGRGYAVEETTRTMGIQLDEIRLPRPEIELGQPEWAEHLRIIGVPPDLLSRGDHGAYHVLVARLESENVATAIAYDHDGDRGIYNVGTLEHARRRGIGTAVSALLVHDARERGCATASLQSSPMAEGIYAAVGFRDLGRTLEYTPPRGPTGR